ncbi:MAG: glycosyltransferase [Clostridia bacterium]
MDTKNGRASGASKKRTGVSIITCTKRPEYLANVFHNYARQLWPKKELIIIVNHDRANLERYRKMAKRYKNVVVYRLPQKKTLGACLNFAVKKAKYDFIAKFDDDDYYAPLYVLGSLRAIMFSRADIVGKRDYYMYLKGSNVLLLRSHRSEHRFVSVVPGATLFVRRNVFRHVRFANRNIGEDVKFCQDCKAKGFRIYSAGKRHFAAIRRKNSRNHTWRISDRRLLAEGIKIVGVKDYRAYVRRPYLRGRISSSMPGANLGFREANPLFPSNLSSRVWFGRE